MPKPALELEVKFLLSDQTTYENRLRGIGAKMLHPRTWEVNYRFDTPDRRLAREHRVLRLRQDSAPSPKRMEDLPPGKSSIVKSHPLAFNSGGSTSIPKVRQSAQ
jgi:adenylate cyclase class IV